MTAVAQKATPPDLWLRTMSLPPAEVLSASTEARDRGVKFEDYAAHGVAEYWLVDPDEEMIEQYLLREGRYRLHIKSNSGVIQSAAIAGFVAPVRAVFDASENLATVQAIMAAAAEASS